MPNSSQKNIKIQKQTLILKIYIQPIPTQSFFKGTKSKSYYDKIKNIS